MRLIRLLNDMHGLDSGTRHIGDVFEVDDEHAETWIGRAVAEYADGLDGRGRRVDPAPTTGDSPPARVSATAVADKAPAAAAPRSPAGSLRQSKRAR